MAPAGPGGPAVQLGILQAHAPDGAGGEPLSPTRVELLQAGSNRLLERLELEEVPQPGRWLVVGERSYMVLQRHHRYQLRAGRYELSTIALLVKLQRQPADARFWQGRWVIGDPSCRFNARSPLLRCAVLPDGPCDRCAHHSPALP